ncbi:hypothetical protein PR048_031393 [Dryococelus australis]|uniref:Uncharacterized protein n=1 Tax=Dryococelus australis TaxID=614101 RepID=A0ABQ9G547_9NEOP|nr:hypothetical protein PR048_031393 [Dryococelus australis]
MTVHLMGAHPFPDWLREALETVVAPGWLLRAARGTLLAGLPAGERRSNTCHWPETPSCWCVQLKSAFISGQLNRECSAASEVQAAVCGPARSKLAGETALQLFRGPGASGNKGATTSRESPVSLLAFHQGEPGSIPGRVIPGFSQVGIVPLAGGFSRGSPISSALAFRRCSIHSHLNRRLENHLRDKSCGLPPCRLGAQAPDQLRPHMGSLATELLRPHYWMLYPLTSCDPTIGFSIH